MDEPRPADNQITERLLAPSYSNSRDTQTIADDELQRIINLSLQNFEEQQKREHENALKLLQQESKKYKAQFSHIKQVVNRMVNLDRTNFHIYELIISVIQMYEGDDIVKYPIEASLYDKVIAIIHTLRLTDNERQIIKDLFIV